MRLADEIMSRVNNDLVSPFSTMPMVSFVDEVYFPHVESQNRASTFKGYCDIGETISSPAWARCGFGIFAPGTENDF
jgi:hypothetical protein